MNDAFTIKYRLLRRERIPRTGVADVCRARHWHLTDRFPPPPNVCTCVHRTSTGPVNIGKKETGLKLPLPAMASGAARLRDFKVIKQLGKGAYGTVYKVERKGDDSAFYALKKVSSANLATR